MPVRITAALVAGFLCVQLAACAERQTYGEPYDPLAAYDAQQAAGRAPTEKGPTPTPGDGEEARPIARPTEGVFEGTGNVVKKPRRRNAVISNPDGKVALNFGATDIREIVDAVLGQTLGLGYTIDDGVKGAIQLRTSKPIPRGDVLPMLESALRASGTALVETDGLYHVVPLAAAKASVPRPRGAGGTVAGLAIQVIPLQFASAKTLAETLKPFVPKEAALNADAARNLMLAMGTGEDVRNLSELIGLFDVDYLRGMSYALVKLDYAAPKSVVNELHAVFGDPKAGPTAGVVEFVPLERLSSVLVVTSQPDYIQQAQAWIDRFDRQGDGEGRQVFVYSVQNRKASELAAILDGVFGSGKTTVGEPASIAPGQTPMTISDMGGQRMPAMGGGNTFQSGSRTVGTGSTGDTRQPPALLGRIGASAGGNGAPGVMETITVRGEGTVQTEANVRVIADEANNALTVLATTQDYKKVGKALTQLDVLPLQVLIEATIAEVTLNDRLRYGLQWFLKSGDVSFTLSNLATGAVESTFPGFSGVLNTLNGDVRVVLDALDEITKVRVLSSPQLMVLNNRTAVLQVGDQVPILTRSAVSVTDPGAPVVNSVEFRDTGVILRVTPRVNESGMVTLDVQQEVSDVVPTVTSNIDSPTIQQRFFESSVAVESGTTIALGGLIEDRRTNGDSGLPVVSQVPIVGNLFKTTTNEFERTELLVLLTPRVVRNTGEARRLTQELRERLTSFERTIKMKEPPSEALPSP
jgi:general secretion pathway protein D